MALYPRMSRPAVRITIEALTSYIPRLTPEAAQIARETIDRLDTVLRSANDDGHRRAAMARAAQNEGRKDHERQEEGEPRRT